MIDHKDRTLPEITELARIQQDKIDLLETVVEVQQQRAAKLEDKVSSLERRVYFALGQQWGSIVEWESWARQLLEQIEVEKRHGSSVSAKH